MKQCQKVAWYFFAFFFLRENFQFRDPPRQSFVNLLEIIWSYFQACQTPPVSSGPIGLINLFLFPPICSDNSPSPPLLSSTYSDGISSTPSNDVRCKQSLPFLSSGGSIWAAAAAVVLGSCRANWADQSFPEPGRNGDRQQLYTAHHHSITIVYN